MNEFAKNFKANRLLIIISTFISFSLIATIIGLILIEFTLSNEIPDVFYKKAWKIFSQTGFQLCIIGIVTLFISLLAFILKCKSKNTNNGFETIQYKFSILTKVFSIVVVCLALILMIINIVYNNNLKIDQHADVVAYISASIAVTQNITIYMFPILGVIESILFFFSMSKNKTIKE